MTVDPWTPPTTAEIRRRWAPGAAVGLVFLVFPAIDIVTGHWAVLLRVLGLAVVVLIGLSYLLVTPAAMLWPLRRQYALLVGLLIISAGLWPVAGSSLIVAWMYIGITAGAVMSFRHTSIVALCLGAGMLLLSRVDHQPAPWELVGALIGLSLWMCAFMGNIKLTRELQATRHELAIAAVTAERARIGRDLHDILGHSLTAIAVKAGLARRMLEQGATGAVDEITDIERLAREALADVRATASGYREVSLGSELAVAATILRSAGISPNLPQAVDQVDPAARELFGYVVREAVTNAVRHSGARSCVIRVGADWVEIRDDGRGVQVSDEITEGSGLRGLGERVRAAGGTMHAGPWAAGGFGVRVDLPAVRSALPTVGVQVATATPPNPPVATAAPAAPDTVEQLR